MISKKLPTAKSDEFLHRLVQSSVVSYSIKSHKFKAASGDRVIREEITI